MPERSDPRVSGAEATTRAGFWALFASTPTPMAVMGDDRRVTALNPAFERVTGHRSDHLVGRPAESFLESTRESCDDVWDAVARDGHAFAWVRIRRPEGALIDAHYIVIADALPGHHAALFVTTAPVGADRTREPAPRAARLATRPEPAYDRFQRSTVPILVLDDERRCVEVNPAAERLLGRQAAFTPPGRLDDLIPEEAIGDLEGLWAGLRSSGAQVGRIQLRDAADETVEVSYSAILDVRPGLHLLILLPGPQSADGDGDGESDERSDPGRDAREALTERERELVALLAIGCNGEEIARRMSISPFTVRTHIRAAMAKRGARTRTHLVALVLADQQRA